MDKLNVYDILSELGYKLKDYGKEYRTKPLYRDSDNDTVLKIYKDTGHWFDFKENISGDFNSLVSMTLKMETPEQAKAWLKNKNFNFIQKDSTKKPLIKATKTFDDLAIEDLDKDHSYWINRGIKLDVLELFRGGIIKKGKMKDRYVFPIFNSRNQIIGFSGRDITNKNKIKWKHIGDKSSWCYPLFISLDQIKNEESVYLVESIGDCLSLYQAGVRNTIVTFGLEISVSILNLLLKLNLNKIYISLNNDYEKKLAGNIAADKAKCKLKRYFDLNQIEIKLPSKKDFGEMSLEEIISWKN